jgi:hypothetical protein
MEVCHTVHYSWRPAIHRSEATTFGVRAPATEVGWNTSYKLEMDM